MGFRTASRTHVGLKRQHNEDALLSLPDRTLWAVADGMGGHEAGDVASATVVDHLCAIEAGLPLPDLAAGAREALAQANRDLLAMGGTRGGGTIGSTVVALAADDQAFICLWVGDSRAYRLRDGSIVQLTKDHSLVQDLVDLGEIDAADAADHPNGNIITRAVGIRPRLAIDSVEGDIRPGDIFLLASDGLTRLVAEDQLRQILSTLQLEPAADHLVRLCLSRGAPDNLSFVILAA